MNKLSISILLLILALSLPQTLFSLPRKITCCGNSITYGGGGQKCYPFQLNSMLGGDWEVLNAGKAATTALIKGSPSYWDTQQFIDAKGSFPNIVVMMFGTNDSKTNNWRGENAFYNDFSQLIDTFLALPSRPKVILGIPLPSSTEWNIQPDVIRDEVAPAVIRLAKDKGLSVVDFYTLFEDKEELYIDDGVHPNYDGYTLIASTIKDMILSEMKIQVNNNVLTAPEGVSYQWYFNGEIMENKTSRSIVAYDKGSYSVGVRLDNNGRDKVMLPKVDVSWDMVKDQIICLGNSITLGDTSTESYPYQLDIILKYFGEVTNAGFPGATVLKSDPNSIWGNPEFSTVINEKPEVFTFMFGTDESKSTIWPGKDIFFEEYGKLIDTFQIANPLSRFYLISPPPSSSSGGIQPKIIQNEIREAIIQLAVDKGAHFIDLYTKLEGGDSLFIGDGVLPNSKGNLFMAEKIAEALFADTLFISDDGYELTAPEGKDYKWYYNGKLLPNETGQTIIATQIGYYKVGLKQNNQNEDRIVTRQAYIDSVFTPEIITSLGNGLTAGNPANSSYSLLLDSMLGYEWKVLNAGATGAVIFKDIENSFWDTDEFNAALSSSPEHITFLFGTNESSADHWTNREDFYKEYSLFIDTFAAANPGARLWLCIPPPVENTAGIQNDIIEDEIIPAIIELAKNKGLNLIDIHSLFEGGNEMFTSDGIYLTHAANAIIAGNFKQYLFSEVLHMNAEGYEVTAPEGYGYNWYIDGTLVDSLTTQTIIATQKGEYAVNIKLHEFTEDLKMTDKIYVDTIYEPINTAINADIANNVKMFPNPSAGVFNLDLSNLNGTTYSIEIIDMQGSVIYQNNSIGELLHVDISTNKTGIYIVKLIEGKTVQFYKLILSNK